MGPLKALLALLACLAILPAQAHPWRELYGDELRFEVRRDGEPVGYYQTRFSGDNSDWQVETLMELEVPWLFWKYRYRYEAQETWRQGALSELDVLVDEDGDQRRHRLVAENGHLVADDGRRITLPIYLSHHYDAGVVNADRWLNTLRGREEPIDVERIDSGSLPAAEQSRHAVEYHYRNKPAGTRVWYDASGRWVGLRFTDRHGGEVELRCVRCGTDRPQ